MLAAIAEAASLPMPGISASKRLLFALHTGRSDLPFEIGDCSVDRLEMLYKKLLVSVVQDGKAFIATEPVKAKINPILACDEIAKDADSKSDKAQGGLRRIGPKE